ncbi:MAG: radical SAM protein [Nannocystaceae bacterium]
MEPARENARTHERQSLPQISPSAIRTGHNRAHTSGLPEFSLYRPRSGHPDWQRLHAEALDIVEQVSPRLSGPRKGAHEWRRRLRSAATLAANYYYNRKLFRSGREDFRPLYFIWTLVRACNFRCEYCDDHRGRKYPDLDTSGTLNTNEATRLLEIMRTRTPSVYFAGGESILRKDLPILTRAARDLAYYPIIINTNASVVHRRLSDPAWRTWLADTDIVVVSLDALDLDVLSQMWKTRHPEDVLRNLLVLRELAPRMNFKLLVNTVIQPDSIDHAGDVLDLANDLGIQFSPVPVNVGPRVDSRLSGDERYLRLAERILARKRLGYSVTGSDRLNRRLLWSLPLDCRNTLKPHIDCDGKLFWPCKSAQNMDPEMIQVLDFDHLDALYDHARSLVDPTNFHGQGPSQCGGDCNWAQNYTTDAYADALRRPWRLFEEIRSVLWTTR